MPPRKTISDAEIGALVREMRRKKEVAQPELGEAIGVSEQMVQKYETGASPLTVVRLCAIAALLKCKVTDLIP